MNDLAEVFKDAIEKSDKCGQCGTITARIGGDSQAHWCCNCGAKLRGNHPYPTIANIPPRVWDDEKKQYTYLKVPLSAEVLSADQLWNNDEVMALNAELGLTIYQLLQLANAITRITHKIPPADWRERFSQAVYDDLAAADNQDVPLEEYPALILKVLDAVIGHEMNPATAEVPMPEPVAYGFGNTAITGHTNRLMMVRIDIPLDDQYAGALWLPLVLADEAHTYGVACRAAGEAAGYARGLRDAVRDADIEALRLYVRALCKAVDAATDFAGTVAGGASWWDDVWADHAAALDRARERISQAALRGEVK